jgi:hypothetical protein
MEPPISPVLFAVLLFVGMLMLLETGRYLGRRRLSKESEGERSSLSAIESAVFAIFGLLIAFTFRSRITIQRETDVDWGEMLSKPHIYGCIS